MEVKDAIEALYISNEKARKYEVERRRKFFDAIGKQDDGRRYPELSKAEYEEFSKGKRVVEDRFLKDKMMDAVVVYSYFAPYHDVSVSYSKSTNTLAENWFYIGD